MFVRIRKWSQCVAIAVMLPPSVVAAQTFNFDFTTSGGFVSNIMNTPQTIIDHNVVTGPLNPFGVTRSVSKQSITSAGPTSIGIAGTFVWYTDAAQVNQIFGSYAGDVQLGPLGSFSFTNFMFLITGGTGLYANLLSIPPNVNSGSGQFFGDPTQPGDVRGMSTIRSVGSALITPEPSTLLLMCTGLGALAITAVRRRKTSAMVE